MLLPIFLPCPTNNSGGVQSEGSRPRKLHGWGGNLEPNPDVGSTVVPARAPRGRPALKAQKGQGLRLQGPGRISHMARCRELQRYWVVTPGFSLGAPNSQGAERSSFWRRG